MKKLMFALLFVACTREPAVEKPASATTPPPATPPPATATAPAVPAVTGPKLPFVDEAAKDPSFVAYRDQLLAAVRARDTKTVLGLIDPKVRTSFGGDSGHGSLTEEHWKALEELLPLGGTFRDGMFWAPYVYSTWPEERDAFEELAIVGDGLPLRESADAKAPAMAMLSRDVVMRAGEPAARGERGAWTKVTTADGKTGFVESKFVRSSVDYRAGFVKTPDGWRMNALVAGD